ncbi:MAG: phenylpropionate dioxygenase-like ring-hydroxylating dioxygenase large terminal subunit [Ilumatobacter sp.]|jgi:phenylpropionate dioxygenase-like ring-hydroxylating dioxygenase large terminal subunit
MTVHVTPVSVQPGDARCPGPSTRDLILGDSVLPPPPLLEQSYSFEGDHDLPYEEFTSAKYAEAEHEHMWGRTWQWACREEHIPEPGDYSVYDVGDRSALVVRGPDGSIKAFHNACLHRGTQLKPPESMGFSQKLRCPFHGWTWSLDGDLVDLPCEWDFPHVNADEYQLPQLRTGTWGGFVFVNFDDCPDELLAPPLEEYLGVIPDHFANWDLGDRYVEVHIRKKLPANWKASAEAFLEAYHILETHSQAIYTAGDANAQYDVFGDNVTRFIHTTAITSPHVPEEKRPDEQALLNMLMARKNPDDPVPTIPDGERARDVYARHTQKILGEQYDNDFSDLSVSETIDSIEYFLFPNAFFFPGLQIPLTYRFRPDGPDPDQCIYEVLYLRPNPRSGKPPLPAEPFDLGVNDSYTTVPGLPLSLAQVLDQDTTNLAAQTRGFKSSKKRGQTLGNYQEVRARHLQDLVRRYINEGANHS